MQRPKFRIVVEERDAAGAYQAIGIADLDSRQLQHVALIVAGVDMEIFALLPAAAKRRITDHVSSGVPPLEALD